MAKPTPLNEWARITCQECPHKPVFKSLATHIRHKHNILGTDGYKEKYGIDKSLGLESDELLEKRRLAVSKNGTSSNLSADHRFKKGQKRPGYQFREMSRRRVSLRRRRFNDNEIRSILKIVGTKSDRAIARELNCHSETIRAIRLGKLKPLSD